MPVLSSTESVEEVVSIPVAKTPESFSDKWLRLFAEKGYTVAMVDAFKREATKQGMDVKRHMNFLVSVSRQNTSQEYLYAL